MIDGLPHTMKLSVEHAERLGERAVEVQEKQAVKPANKSRTPSNKK